MTKWRVLQRTRMYKEETDILTQKIIITKFKNSIFGVLADYIEQKD